MNEVHRSVAIDGPSGAGKSSIARRSAKALGFIYVDTGAIYRTVGLAVRRAEIGSRDIEKIKALLPTLEIALRYADSGEQRMFLNGEDVSGAIRTPEISLYASDVSAFPEVRAYLMETQRSLARENDTVMDGRDIGTVVLKDATVKIYLTASPESRARRRMLQLREKGDDTPFDNILAEVNARDYQDTHRETDPLRRAEDAVLVDSSDLTFDETVDAILTLVEAKK